MSRTIYALVVGINAYDSPQINDLSGCVNDARAMADFLTQRANAEGWQLALQQLLSYQGQSGGEPRPTRQNIINAFRTHLRKAGKDDIALFYYSGHGSQEHAPALFWPFEPDHLNETLVCCDSRNGEWDLADKELAKLIQEVAGTTEAGQAKDAPHIVVLIDACHSGSITREANVTTRLAPIDGRQRELKDYIDLGAQVKDLAVTSEVGGAGWFSLPQSPHVLMSACRAEQTAKEKPIDGSQRGVFTYYLLDVLQAGVANLSYRDVMRSIDMRVNNEAGAQNPQLEAPVSEDLNRLFLDGALKPAAREITVSQDPNTRTWFARAGRVHGLHDGTQLVIYALGTDLTKRTNYADALATARVSALGPTQADLEITWREGIQPDQAINYTALVTSPPVAPVAIVVDGDAVGVQTFTDLLNSPAPENTARLFAQIVPHAELAKARFKLIALSDNAGYQLIRLPDERDMFVSAKSVQEALLYVEHVARWQSFLDLQNPASQLRSKTAGKAPVSMEVRRYDNTAKALEAKPIESVAIEADGVVDAQGKTLWPSYEITVTNNTDQRLYVDLYDITNTYNIKANFIQGQDKQIEPGQSVQASITANGRLFTRIPFGLPKALIDKGITKVVDVFKLVASTQPFGSELLEQRDLIDALQSSRDTAKDRSPQNSLTRLFRRITTRDASADFLLEDEVMDFYTTQVTFTTYAPSRGVTVPNAGTASPVAVDGRGAVRVHPHPSLKAQVGIETVEQGARSVGNVVAPAIFRDSDAAGKVTPFDVMGSRDGNTSLIKVTLDDASARDAVSVEQPLRITVDQPLRADEAVLITTFDAASELHVPVGIGVPSAGAGAGAGDGADDGTGSRSTELYIQRLPLTSQGERSPRSAILMALTKFLSNTLKTGANPNKLWLCTFEMQPGAIPKMNRTDDVEAAKQAVASAERVLIFVHGFTGDSDNMPLSALQIDAGVAQGKTVVLAYDYENLITDLELTAVDLRNRLSAVGLAPGHTKSVTVIAHSLGTILTRCVATRIPQPETLFQHAILVGGPHQGTILARSEDLIAFLVGAAVNYLVSLTFPWAWLPKLIGMMGSGVAAAKTAIVTLDQIKPNSKLLTVLNDPAVDRGVHYSLIAGDARHVTGDSTAKLAALGRKLVSYTLFADQPNDLVISAASIQGVPKNRVPAPYTPPAVPVSHIDYFRTPEGITAIKAALERPL